MNFFESIFKGLSWNIRTSFFPEQLFMGHSWQRVPDPPIFPTPRILNLIQPLFPIAPTFTAIFYVLFV